MSEINPNDIAIVGLNCRFPGADSPEQFWQNLRDGVESVTFFTPEELKARGVPMSRQEAKNFVNASPVIDNIEQFDASFFGYAPREAKLLDPQHRLFLQTAWGALESAGYDPEQYQGAIGVFAGMGISRYLLFNLVGHPDVATQEEFQVMLGNDKDFLSTRVAYHFDLKGPSIDVQTGCSTSLVATHLACDSLLSFQCDMALVGGITLDMPHRAGYLHQVGGIEAPDGHCRPFSADGQGTIFGSGVGVVVLKRLEDAMDDGDTVHAVIKGSAINNDGSAKLGYTAPSVEGQADVILRAQRVAEVEPDTIQYVETHGTATELGDPIEAEALTQAFRNGTEQNNFCAIGSVKSNIGHLDAAAGVAGLIKTTLSLKHGEIPPSLNFSEPNPRIDLASSPFFVNDKLRPFKQLASAPHRAGVSSFGIGGTNAHVILEAPPLPEPSSDSRSQQLLLLSAQSETALQTATEKLVAYLQGDGAKRPLADITHTLQRGRQRFSWRQSVVVTSHTDAVEALTNQRAERAQIRYDELKTRPVAFMFSGQGSQYAGMGQGLYESEPIFRDAVDQCCAIIQREAGFDLRQILYGSLVDGTERLTQTAVTQPALFTISYALAQLWQAWGVVPTAMIGHSIGEFVAACVAEVFSLEDALKLVCARGQLMQALPSGSMLAVSLNEEAVQPYLTTGLSVGVINAPDSCVLSGTDEAIEGVEARLNADGHFCRRLHTSHAFHSPMMEPALVEFQAKVEQMSLNSPQLPYISNVTGTWITAEQATSPEYWADHIRQTVRFGAGVATLLTDPHMVLLEVGPGKALATLARRQFEAESAHEAVATLRHPKEPEPDMTFLLKSMGQLWLTGVTIDWTEFYANETRHRLPLPTYPFETQRYWIDPPQGLTARSTKKKTNVNDWFYTPSWKRTASPQLPNDLEPQRWLVFVDGKPSEWQTGILQSLQQSGQQIVQVQLGRQFNKLSDEMYTIGLGKRADYDALVTAVGKIDRILDLWPMVSNADEITFAGPLFLAQALEKAGQTQPIRWQIVTTHLHSVTGTETIQPVKAVVMGAIRVIPQEYAHIQCQLLDVTPDSNPNWVLAESTQEPVVAYRGRYRWVRTYEPFTVQDEADSLLRPQGVYLITGGLGGLGLTIAQQLAKTVQARLVLVGRSPFPAREQWDTVTDERLQRRIQAVQALEEAGAEVAIVQADVTTSAGVQTAVDTAITQFGVLHGVVHAAGVAGGGMIPLKTFDSAQEVFAPKVRATQHLQVGLAEQPLDFLMLFSSVTSILGGLGQIDYCAANAYLDAFAHSQPLPFPVLGVNWDEWQQVGMAVDADMPAEMKRWRDEQLQQGILPIEGGQAFLKVLQNPQPQLIVSTRDFGAMQERSASMSIATMLAELQQMKPVKVVRTGGNGRSANYVAPTSEIEQTIVNIWQQALDLDKIGIHDNFFDLGGNSLIGLQLVNRINEALNLQISAVSLYESPTIYKLTQMITDGDQEEASEASKGRGARRRERRLRKKKQR